MVKEANKLVVLNVEQAREILGISRNLAYEGIRTGQIPSIRIGRRILIPKEALERKLSAVDNSAKSNDYEHDAVNHAGTGIP